MRGSIHFCSIHSNYKGGERERRGGRTDSRNSQKGHTCSSLCLCARCVCIRKINKSLQQFTGGLVKHCTLWSGLWSYTQTHIHVHTQTWMCDLNRNFWRSQRAENREALIRIQRSNTQSTRHADKHTRDEALNYAGPPISHSHSLGVTLVQSRREEVATNYQGDQHTKTVWPCRSSWTVNNLINQQRLPENPTNYISANPGCIHPAKITPKVPTSFSAGSYFCPFSTISKNHGKIRGN